MIQDNWGLLHLIIIKVLKIGIIQRGICKTKKVSRFSKHKFKFLKYKYHWQMRFSKRKLVMHNQKKTRITKIFTQLDKNIMLILWRSNNKFKHRFKRKKIQLLPNLTVNNNHWVKDPRHHLFQAFIITK